MRRWRIVHEWTSLACTLFLFVLCLTGLPLIFADEIGGAHPITNSGVTASLDGIVQRSGVRPAFVRIAADEGRIYVGPAGGGRPLLFDMASGAAATEGRSRSSGMMDLLLAIHGELFVGLAGRLFIAAVGLCALASVVSGIMIYAPFAGSRPFADIRTARTRRLAWLDRHNVIGIATAAWLMVVAGTGVMNAVEHPLFALWRQHVPDALAPASASRLRIGPDRALAAARASAPGMIFETIIFPGKAPGIPGYFLVWGEGKTPLTARLAAPVTIDAASGLAVGSGTLPMPWYLTMLDLSRPLHFGDYGGLPLKILWALLDGTALIVLGSGLHLWLARHRRDGRIRRATSGTLQSINLEAAE